jgi:AraC family L-rhamnose operon transcriptional activator RhaR/AraC family L-rhamnose operon regulatory protein RhaS
MSIMLDSIEIMDASDLFMIASGKSPGAVNLVKNQKTLGFRHRHDFHELTVVLDGHGTYEYQGCTYSISSGDTFITLPGEIHHYRNQQNLSLMNFIWYPEQLPVSPEKLLDIPGYRTFFSLEPQSRSIFKFEHRLVLTPDKIYFLQNYFRRIEKELQHRSEGTIIYVGLIFVELLISVSRFFNEKQKNIKSVYNELQKLDDVLNFLHDNIANQVTLAQAAKIFGSSENNFFRIFKRIMQESFSDYLLNLRLQHARNLLLTSNKLLSEIALESGFCDSNYLCFRFRKKFGQSPHQFRIKNNPYFK